MGGSWEFFSCSQLEGSLHYITPGYISKINERRLVRLIYCASGVYFDDVIINSLSCELHLKDLNEVLVRTEETGITVKCKKCQF